VYTYRTAGHYEEDRKGLLQHTFMYMTSPLCSSAWIGGIGENILSRKDILSCPFVPHVRIL
jgi:hypothetical protein